MRARVATPAERTRLWPRVVDLYGGYQDYQERTDREIPLVILEPRSPDDHEPLEASDDATDRSRRAAAS